MSIQPGANLYGIGVGSRPESVEVPFVARRAPLSSDALYPIGKRWIQQGVAEYILVSFSPISGGGVSANWIQSAGNNLFPITPYVVGPVGLAGYQTIQSAINAANAAGGGFIFVQNATYTENLTLYPNISISGPQILSGFPGSPAACVIQGSHTPPTSGSMTFNNITFVSTGDTFASTAAGTAELNFTNSGCNVTDGYFLNIPNWTGILSFWDFNSTSGTNDGGINNPTGGASVFCFEAGLGKGTTHTMQISGLMVFNQGEIYCPVQFNTGTQLNFANDEFFGPVTFAGNTTGFIYFSSFITNAGAAITMSSSANINISQAIVNTTHNPAIAGSGAGTITLSDITFTSNTSIANTLTFVGLTLTPTVNTSLSTGTLSIKSTTGNNGNNTGFIATYVGGTLVYVPYFANIAP